MIALSLLAGALALQAAPDPIEAGRIDAGWLDGCWQGEGLGSAVTECWMSAPSGRMTGMFQLLNADGTQRFSEIFVLDVFDDGPALRLKHFHPDLTGWEAQDDFVSFALIEQSENRLVFSGLEYRLDGEDTLVVDLTIRRDDEPHVERLTFQRVR
ncbi:MAG: DUF6265 family protein [Oceanicaulis sp.]